MKGYKGFKEDWTCRDFQYKVGETYEMDGEISLCERGFHFCKELSDVFPYYPYGIYAEVEVLGDVIENSDEGSDSKCVTNKIKIIRQLDDEEIRKITNYGRDNIGFMNHGNFNEGRRNYGNFNSGHHNYGSNNKGCENFGDENSGNQNYGIGNDGHHNYGPYNEGNFNYGSFNSGESNYGAVNSGSQNYGAKNSGDCNYGMWNEGSNNYGDFNLCSEVMGSFNTLNLRSGVQFFDKSCPFYSMGDWFASEVRDIFKNIPIDKSMRQSWWSYKSEDEKSYIILKLPNFDAEIFYKITGIKI